MSPNSGNTNNFCNVNNNGNANNNNANNANGVAPLITNLMYSFRPSKHSIMPNAILLRFHKENMTITMKIV